MLACWFVAFEGWIWGMNEFEATAGCFLTAGEKMQVCFSRLAVYCWIRPGLIGTSDPTARLPFHGPR